MSVMEDLMQRELGGAHYCRRTRRRCCNRGSLASHPRSKANPVEHSIQILTDLISSSNREFVPVTRNAIKATASGVSYANHMMLVKDAARKAYDCLSVRNPLGRPRYSLKAVPKWEDEVIVGATSNVSSCSLQVPVIFVLRKHNVLERYNLETGALLNAIALTPSPSSHEVYKELNFNYDSGVLAAKSTRKSKPAVTLLAEGSPDQDVLVSFILFRYPSLELWTKLEVRKSVFGDKIIDADIVAQTLMVLEPNSVTKVYDLEQVAAGQPPSELRRGEDDYWTVIVQKPHTRIPKAPPCLAEIKSYKQYIVLSPSLNYIYVDVRDRTFQVKRLNGTSPASWAVLGKYDLEALNTVAFSPDPSSRIITKDSSLLKIYEYNSENTLSEVLRLSVDSDHICFTNYSEATSQCLHCKRARLALPPPPPVESSTTRSGRRVRGLPSLGEDLFAQGFRNNLVTWDYEDELGILVVLSYANTVSSDDDDDETNEVELCTVTLIDNVTLAVIKEVPIDRTDKRGTFDVNTRVFVTLDRDVLVLTVQSCVKTTTYLYQLKEVSICEEGAAVSQKKSKGVKNPRLSRTSATRMSRDLSFYL